MSNKVFIAKVRSFF